MTQVTTKKFLKPGEAARHIGVSMYALKRMTDAGVISRVPGTKTYRLCDLERLVKGGDRDADTARAE